MSTLPQNPLAKRLGDIGLSDAEIRAELSPMFATIAREIGLPATLALVDALGGSQIYVPGSASGKHRLSEIAGTENAQKIIDIIGGDRHVAFPSCFSQRTITRLCGLKLLKAGKNANAVAKELMVSRGTVLAWRSKYRDETWAPVIQPRPGSAA